MSERGRQRRQRRRSRPSRPVATYRLQLHAGFGFAEAAELAGYLADLGVSHVYLSPILQARKGSMHGYDVIDHTRISADLGGEAGFRAMVARFHAEGLGVVLDIVPNHMAVPAPATLNRPLWSVLTEGRGSPYARWFDIDWEAGGGRVLLPVLGGPYERCRADGELVEDRSAGLIRYHDHVFPISGAHCRPVHWRDQVNYRRFFEISDLIGLRAEDPEVFDATHIVPLTLIEEGLVDGLRVDHPDGLADPRGYLRRLTGRAAEGTWIVVEKILTGAEELPGDWPCAGTTGYDALGMVCGLFVDPAGEPALTEAYTRLTGGPAGLTEVEYESKRYVAEHGLAPEVDRLNRVLVDILPKKDPAELRTVLVELLVAMPVYRAYVVPGDPPSSAAEQVIAGAVERARPRLPARLHTLLEVIAELAAGRVSGVLPTGSGELPKPAEFVVRFQQTTAPLTAKGVEDTAFYRWSRLASLNEVGGDPARFGIEPGGAEHDGSGPASPGPASPPPGPASPPPGTRRSGAPDLRQSGWCREVSFHAYCRRLARDWPDTMTALSTHDSKRQEDVRARLAVLSELPVEWAAAVARWRSRAGVAAGGRAPEPDLDYLIWQTLVGAWPIDRDRLVEFVTKAMREAKTSTSWTETDPEYEKAVTDHAERVLADTGLTEDLDRFVRRIAPYARVNALGQKLVQLTMPGVPDVYQGCELAGTALVDPDNRRPVDYELRRSLLAGLDGDPGTAGTYGLDGEKLLVTTRALRLRGERPEWFGGGYDPLEATGAAARHVVAFRRGEAVTVVTRLPAGLRRRGGWRDTVVETAPGGGAAGAPGPSGPAPVIAWRDVLGGTVHQGGALPLGNLLADLPVVLLVPER